MLLICLSETLLRMEFLSCQKVFNLFLPLNILTKHCSEKNLKNSCRKFRLKWFFCNDERQFNINPFKQKSKFNSGKNDAANEFYLS